jgi:hypothetical protein
VAGGWLKRSGQTWKIRAAVFAAVTGISFLVLALVGGRVLDHRFGGLVVVSSLLALPLLLLNLVLPLVVRCGVCGLQVETSQGARTLSRGRRLGWLESLETCPVCGDNGLASAESRQRWLASGQSVERPYWSLARIVLAAVVAVVLIGGGVWIGGRYRVR